MALTDWTTRDETVLVSPVPGGWCVESSLTGSLMFLSGAKAEEKARGLAECLAAAGWDAQVVVHDRAQQVAGTRRYFATAG